ncbi:hypothetical protein BDZ89DRAFT_1071416 [Hymenopellis radicata]|nr:hypothetical protein BDZ89DRAFT_1071416 [Hymenopellis radicata]
MTASIYLCCYLSEHGLFGLYHWAIVVARGRLNQPVNVYSITQAGPEEWKKTHKSDVILFKERRIFALVPLPRLNVPFEEAASFLSAEDPTRGNSPPLHKIWSCAQWVIRSLQRMKAFGWFTTTPAGNLSDHVDYYEYMYTQKALRCETALKARATFPDFVGEVVDGVRLLRP